MIPCELMGMPALICGKQLVFWKFASTSPPATGADDRREQPRGALGLGSPRLLDLQLPPAACTPGRNVHSLRPVAWRLRPTRRANGRKRTCMAFSDARMSVEVVRQVSRAGKAIRAQHSAPDRRLKELIASSARPTRPVDLRVGFVPGVRDLAGHDVRARLDPSRITNHLAHVSVHSLPTFLLGRRHGPYCRRHADPIKLRQRASGRP